MKKKIMAAMLAALVLSQGMATFAKPANNNPTGDGHTTIGIMEFTTNVGQASFEVPLYVTTAAIKDQTKLVCPDGYDIKNTAGSNNGNSIGVLSVTVDRLPGATWETVQDAAPTGDKEVKMTIGDLTLPTVNNTIASATIDIRQSAPAHTSAFYDNVNDRVRLIGSGKTLSEAAGEVAETNPTYKGLSIIGVIAAKDRANTAAAVQFRIRYVISALDAEGNPVGSIYVGDNKAAAGF